MLLTEPELEPKGALDPLLLLSEFVTLSSTKSSSIQSFMLISTDEYDPIQVFLLRTSPMKWAFVLVHSYQSHDQHLVQSLRSRCFVMSQFITRGQVFSNHRRIERDNEDPTSYWKTYLRRREA